MTIRPARPGRARGQGMVEFALVGGIFFFVIIATINGGLFLYARNATEHSTDVGMTAIASEGSYNNSTTDNADTVAIARMSAAGLGTTNLVSVSEIDVIRQVQQSDGTLVNDPAGCPLTCSNKYRLDGSCIQCPAHWPPSSRDIKDGESDFARLEVHYRYQAFGMPWALNSVAVKTFRLEPQT